LKPPSKQLIEAGALEHTRAAMLAYAGALAGR
jgi:hypothetical protein